MSKLINKRVAREFMLGYAARKAETTALQQIK